MKNPPLIISDSILSSVKKLIGISEDDKSFDIDIILHINAASSILFQLGVLSKPYTVTSEEDIYADLIPDGTEDVVNLIKMYFVYKTKLGFDSTTLTGTVIDTIQKEIDEIEYRLLISFNPKSTFDRGGEIQNE